MDRRKMIEDLTRWSASCLVDGVFFWKGTMCGVQEAPAKLLEEAWRKNYALDCYRRGVDPKDGKALTRGRLEKLAYAATHKDFKGNGCLLVGRPGGACLVPLGQATEAELYAKLGVL